MAACDSHDHHRQLSQELVVDCGYTRVIASRVGAFGSSVVRAAKPGDFTRAQREKPQHHASTYIPRSPPENLREFTLEELGKATENFSDERMLGRGGFGKVFKGILSDGAVVAVKVMNKHYERDMEQFQAEMRTSCTIMGIDHPNLLRAIGYHSSRKRKMAKIMMVYPFMANRDVGRHLGDVRPSSLTLLDWTTRKRIALGVARGICTLHQLGIIHGDIKPSNVMLDESFDAYVGDFGLAKSIGLPGNNYDMTGLHDDGNTHDYEVTHIFGTIGYLSPEMHSKRHFSSKSDVYAFGLTLIQIVTGKTLSELEKEPSWECFGWTVKVFVKEQHLTRHMHPAMLGMYIESEAIELIQLGLICTQHDPEKRPVMTEVIAIMEGSSTTLKRIWDKYKHTWSSRQLWAYNKSSTASGSERGNMEEESCCSYWFNTSTEELKENLANRNLLQQAEDFTSEELNNEYLADNVGHQLHGYLSVVPCYNTGDAISGVSGAESTCIDNSRSLENDTCTEIVEVYQNSQQLSSQANQYEVATKLREVQDQMWEMELKHQAAMEEMHQKQIAIMQSMIKMQGEYIQKVNEMQSRIMNLSHLNKQYLGGC